MPRSIMIPLRIGTRYSMMKYEMIRKGHNKTEENKDFHLAISELLANMHSQSVQLRLDWLCLSEGEKLFYLLFYNAHMFPDFTMLHLVRFF